MSGVDSLPRGLHLPETPNLCHFGSSWPLMNFYKIPPTCGSTIILVDSFSKLLSSYFQIASVHLQSLSTKTLQIRKFGSVFLLTIRFRLSPPRAREGTCV